MFSILLSPPRSPAPCDNSGVGRAISLSPGLQTPSWAGRCAALPDCILPASPSIAGAQSFLQQTWASSPSISVSHSILILRELWAHQARVVWMMLRVTRWGSGPRDAQSKGRFGIPLARHSRAGLYNCLLCGVAERESLMISGLASIKFIDGNHKLISSWINMITVKDMSILISASTTEILVLMAMLTNVHGTLQIRNMPFLARVTCSLVHILILQLRGTVVCNLMYPLSHASSPVVQLDALFCKGSN